MRDRHNPFTGIVVVQQGKQLLRNHIISRHINTWCGFRLVQSKKNLSPLYTQYYGDRFCVYGELLLPALFGYAGFDSGHCLFFSKQGGQFVALTIVALGHIGAFSCFGNYGIQHFHSFFLCFYVVRCKLYIRHDKRFFELVKGKVTNFIPGGCKSLDSSTGFLKKYLLKINH